MPATIDGPPRSRYGEITFSCMDESGRCVVVGRGNAQALAHTNDGPIEVVNFSFASCLHVLKHGRTMGGRFGKNKRRSRFLDITRRVFGQCLVGFKPLWKLGGRRNLAADRRCWLERNRSAKGRGPRAPKSHFSAAVRTSRSVHSTGRQLPRQSRQYVVCRRVLDGQPAGAYGRP